MCLAPAGLAVGWRVPVLVPGEDGRFAVVAEVVHHHRFAVAAEDRVAEVRVAAAVLARWLVAAAPEVAAVAAVPVDTTRDQHPMTLLKVHSMQSKQSQMQ